MHRNFYPRPPQGGRRIRYAPISVGKEFLSTPSARRATRVGSTSLVTHRLFLSTPSARRATHAGAFTAVSVRDFYPRHPRGGRPALGALEGVYGRISIHALREEGDASAAVDNHNGAEFLSTPSARRTTAFLVDLEALLLQISIHALREEGDPGRQRIYRCRFDISIHALREEGDSSSVTGAGVWADFYPRPPRGGRPLCPAPDYRAAQISIHALREEGDRPDAVVRAQAPDFYPRPPRGGRLVGLRRPVYGQ